MTFDLRLVMRHACGLAVATVAAITAERLHLPLPWVLGPLLAIASLSLLRIRFTVPKHVRRVGQVIIGATVGLSITATVAGSLLPLAPLIVAAALFAVVLSAALSILLARLTGLDGKTAFFAMMPGGLSEMGTIGESMGAKPEPIVLCQTLRVAFVVCIIPPLYNLLLDIEALEIAARPSIDLPLAAGLTLAGATASYLLSLLRLNVPWTVGSLVCVGFWTSILALDGRMPVMIFHIGQILIGYSIGSKLDVLFLLGRPRITSIAAVIISINMIVTAALAVLLPFVSDLDLPSAILATSPGGMAEMIATSHTFHLSVVAVTAFQSGRTLIVNGLSGYYWSFFVRIGFFRMLGGEK